VLGWVLLVGIAIEESFDALLFTLSQSDILEIWNVDRLQQSLSPFSPRQHLCSSVDPFCLILPRLRPSPFALVDPARFCHVHELTRCSTNAVSIT
jgi:hypothetical protein